MKKSIVAAMVMGASAGAFAEYRFWKSEAESAALSAAANWNPEPGEEETLGNDDKLYLNKGTNYIATVSEGDAFTTYRLYIGRGMSYDWETGTESNSTSYDKGARVDVLGGELNVTNELWVGAGYSDNDSDILNVKGGKVSVQYLRAGDCANNNGKRNEINVTGGVLELLGETQFSTYSGGTTYMDVSGSGIVSNTAYFRSSTWGKTYIDVRDGGRFVSTGEMRLGQRGSDDNVPRTEMTICEGGVVEFSGKPHVGQGGPGVLTVDGGELTVTSEEIFIGQDDYGDGTFIVKGGTVNLKTPQVGRDGSDGKNPKGVMRLEGGTVICDYTPWFGNFNLGWGSNAIGELYMSNDAKLQITGYTSFGRSGVGYAEINGGTLAVTNNNICLGNDSTGDGTLVINGGEVSCKSDFYVGNSGKGHLVMNGGKLSFNYWLDISRSSDSTIEGNVFDFNGGELTCGLIHAASTNTVATLNWNGGVFKPNDNYDWVMDSEGRLTVNVLKGGAIFDAGDNKSRSFNQTLSGPGAFTKRGSKTVYLKKCNDLRGGYIVESGWLVLESQLVTENRVLRKIAVSEGAVLDLRGTESDPVEVKVLELVNNGQILNGTVTVVKLASAEWTNAAGDGDVANADNWTVVTEDGMTVEGVLPTEDCEVTIPAGLCTADFSSVSCKSLTVVASGSTALPNRGAVAPAIVKSAAGWYDPSDASTVTMNEQGGVAAIANKGAKGASLDLQPINSTHRLPGYGEEWKLNGRNLFAFTNAYGFVSKEKAGLSNGQDRTLVTIDLQQRNTYHTIKDGAVQDTYENQMFSIGLAREMWNNSGRFDIEQWDGSYQCYYPNGTKLNDSEESVYNEAVFNAGTNFADWVVWDMGSRSGQVRVNIYPADGDAIHRGPSNASPLNESEDVYVTLGQRWLYDSPSSGMLAESLFFDKELSDDELAEVREYLNAKWFTASVAIPTSFALAEDATLDLNCNSLALDTLSGSGTIGNGEVTQIGTLVVTVNDDGTIDPITLGCDFDLTKLGAIKIVNAKKLAVSTPLAVLSVAEGCSLTGAFAGTIVSDAASVSCKASLADGSLRISRRGGLVIMVR